MTLFFFHLGNAALLPLLGQSAVARFDVNAASYTAGTVVLAQVTMILTALWGVACCSEKRLWPAFLHGTIGTTLRGCIAGLWNDTLELLYLCSCLTA